MYSPRFLSRLLPTVIAVVAIATLATTCALAAPTISLVANEQTRINLTNSSVTANGAAWNVTLYMANDNDYSDATLGDAFRRWWNVKIDNLNTGTGETLNIQVTHSGYDDIVTPVWSLDDGATWSRISSTPVHTGSGGSNVHTFTVVTPPGNSSIRLAKWYPVTLASYDTWRAGIVSSPYVTEVNIGNSYQGRSMWMYEITDSSYASAGKKRVWIHTSVHCSENTAFFTAQGLVNWLITASPEARGVLAGTIIDIVPMANPDGVAIGNYRTTANGLNLENYWFSPYNSTQPEIVAMRTKIEQFMGTVGSPGANPITLLLNLHSSHNVDYPFHFVHAPSYLINSTGVSPTVNALEQLWVSKLRARSGFLNHGADMSSTLSGRVFVESMMHDRYSNFPGTWSPVMAITIEGTYQLNPAGNSTPPNTPNDYRTMGQAVGQSILDYYGLAPATVSDWQLY